MTDYGTIRIPREDFERHNERRKDMNCSWVEYLDGQSPDGTDLDPIMNRLDDLENTIPRKTVEELR